MTDLPAEILYGKVTGRFLQAVADSVDPEGMPDAQPSTGSVKFTPLQPNLRVTSPAERATVTLLPFICELDAGGNLVDAQGNPEVWLAVGAYEVTFNIKNTRIAPLTIVVTPEYTEPAPLDLALVIPPDGPPFGAGQYAELSYRISDLEDNPELPESLAEVATTGDYEDLSNKPVLGTASTHAHTDYATAAQGALATTALQAPDHIDILPASLAVISGTPTLAYVSTLGAGMMFDGVADECMYLAVPVPSSWAAVTLVLYWTTASTGTVRWKTYISSFTPDNLWPTGPSLITDAPIVAASKQVRSVLNTAVAVTPGSLATVRIDRLASSSVDTITTDACLQLVQLLKAG